MVRDSASSPIKVVGEPVDIDTEGTPSRTARDLTAILALPAMWLDHEPAAIAADLLEILVSMLRLQSAYVRFEGGGRGPVIERWHPDGPRAPIEIARALRAAQPGDDEIFPAPSIGVISVARVAPAIPGEGGLVLAGAKRPDFPTASEMHVLRAAVGQATVSIFMARRLAEERAARVAAQAAVRERNAFLAALVRDLAAPLDLLAEHAARARRLAAESEAPDSAAALGSTHATTAPNAFTIPAGVARVADLPARLTRREAEVLGLLAQGLSNREIAAVLSLSDRTVERHITGIYRKIGVERRSEATAFALRHGIADTKTM